MTCPHLEETSALFDGVADERARTHAEGCEECKAFLADAAGMRAALRAAAIMDPLPLVPRVPLWRRRILVPVPAFLVVLVLLTIAVWTRWPRQRGEIDSGAFAGLDGGGRTVIAVREVAR